MKYLFIIRHAKSDQHFFGNDFERPLNERGKLEAPIMAKRLVNKNLSIDYFVSSPAKRAKKTAELFAAEFHKTADEVVLVSALYHAPEEVFFEVIQQLPATANNVAIFSHNPGISFFVNSLITTVNIDDMPTCGVFAIKVNTDNWKDFKKATKEFLFFDYPKAG